jgi:asparagine synthase (glutamine-hydrolysing)
MNLSNYEKAKSTLHDLLDNSIKSRLVSDVPLGTFLSGGIDSSIITSVAAKYVDNLQTFSIGYKDEPFFDETHYAELVAKKAGTHHTVFKLTNDDLLDNLSNVLDYMDEPFGDSSAIAVSILSKLTRQHISVALSGDGADEMFSGYNKHMAEFKVRDPGVIEQVVKGIHPLLEKLPQGRNNKFTNLTRQMNRYAQGAKMNHKQRYWRWASFINEEEANYLLLEIPQERDQRLSDVGHQYKKRKDNLLKTITKSGGLNDVLYTDMHMVLQNDMLTKVDMMSMSHSLEVRTPFLDHHVVNFAFELPTAYKINSQMRKKILVDAFQHYLPNELLNRPKHGFEVPLLKWFRNELKPLITDDLLSEDFIIEQEIFNPKSINALLKKLFSKNPGDSHATVWALIVFQYWWKKHMCN